LRVYEIRELRRVLGHYVRQHQIGDNFKMRRFIMGEKKNACRLLV
jgi:hypothetical protein